MVNPAFESLETRRLLAASPWPTTSVDATPVSSWEDTKTFTVNYDSTTKVRRASLDNRDITVVGPNGYRQRAKLESVSSESDSRQLTAIYSVTAPEGLWSNAENGKYEILVNGGQVRDIENNPTRTKGVGAFDVDVPQYPTDLSSAPPAQSVIRVSDFGAFPNDGIDDSDAIQAAVDSLPLAAGIPNGISPIGGIVAFDAGEYRLTKAIKIFSGVWLRGVGNQTVLHNVSTNRNDTAILGYSPYSHQTIFGARVENLRILTDATRGFYLDPNTVGDANNLRLSNLSISSGNVAIDCKGTDVYQSLFENITVENSGAAAMFLWVDFQNSAINLLKNITVRGPARAGFDASQPLLTLGGQMTIEGMTIEDVGRVITPFETFDYRGTVRGLSILTSNSNLAGGEMMRLNRSWIRFDRVDGLSAARRVRLVATKDAHFEQATVEPWSTLAASLVADSTSHVTIGTLYGGGRVGSVAPGRLTVRSISEFGLPASSTTPPPAVLGEGPLSPVVVNVTDFGAFGNDPDEDTAQIQAAIDALPRGNGIPGTGSNVGGTVLFPIGTFITAQALRVPSGVWLVGNGWGTTLRNMSLDVNSPGIVFVGARGMNIGAGVQNFSIHTFGGSSITADSTVSRALVDVHIANIAVESAKYGIDFRQVRVEHGTIDSLSIDDPRESTIYLGNKQNTDVRVTYLHLVGTTVAGAQPQVAHIVLNGETTFNQGWLELSGIGSLPFFASGSATISSFWLENHILGLPEIMSFQDITRLDIDIMLLVDDDNKLKFRNSSNVHIKMLDIAGKTPPLSKSLDLDSVSRLKIDTVNAIYDVGMLDDPRVAISGIYNQNAKTYVDTFTAANSPNNLLVDPNFYDVGPDEINGWRIRFGDTYGAVEGWCTIETTPTGRRLKIVITSDPNNRGVRLDPQLYVPPSAYGKQAVLSYRIDGPGTPIAWGENCNYQYCSRVTNSLTAVATSTPISANTALTIVIPGGVGTYYVSQVGLIANG